MADKVLNVPENSKGPEYPAYREYIKSITKSITEDFIEKLQEHENKDDRVRIIKEIISNNNVEQQNRHKKVFRKFIALSIVAIILISLTTWKIMHKSIVSAQKNTIETQHQLQTIIRMADDKLFLTQIENNLRKLTHYHSEYAKKYGTPWRDYSPEWYRDMAYEIMKAYQFFGIKPEVFYAIACAEDHMRYWRTSYAGAQGLLQILPIISENICSRWKYDDIDMMSPSDNIKIGALIINDITYLGNKHYTRFTQEKVWNIRHIAGSWNGGITYYGRWIKNSYYSKHKIPMYDETEEFIEKVSFYYESFIQDPPNFSVMWEEYKKDKGK